MRQGQALVMTPLLLQAIKLLQLSNLELSAFVEEQLEANPLLERAEPAEDGPAEAAGEAAGEADWSDEGDGADAGSEGDWARACSHGRAVGDCFWPCFAWRKNRVA